MSSNIKSKLVVRDNCKLAFERSTVTPSLAVVQVAIFCSGLLVALFPIVYLPLTQGAGDLSQVSFDTQDMVDPATLITFCLQRPAIQPGFQRKGRPWPGHSAPCTSHIAVCA
jgi:hypothetical protein